MADDVNTKSKFWLAAVIPLFWFSLYAYMPYLTDHVVSLGASLSFAGVITGLYGLTQMFLRIPAGIWSDRIGRRRPFVIAGCILSAVSAAGLYFAQTPELVLVFRCLAGAAASCWVQMSVLYASFFRAEKTAGAVSSALALNNFGQLSGVACGMLATVFLPVSATFLLALAGGLAGVVLSFMLRETPAVVPKESLLSALLSNRPALARLFSASFLAILGHLLLFAGPNGFSPRLARELFSASPLQMGIMTMAILLFSVFSTQKLSPLLREKLGPRTAVQIGFAVCTLYFLLVPIVPNFNFLLGMQAVYGLGQGVLFPILMSQSIIGVDESRRGVFMGVFQSIYGLGMFLGPALLGVLGDVLGLSAGFAAIGFFGVAAIVLSFFLRF